MRLFSPNSNDLALATSTYEQEVFQFCSEWKAGKMEFQFHSSGSTGKPKSIILSREHMIESVKLTRDWLSLEPRDIALLALPVQYIAGAMVLVRALVLDLDVLLVEPCQNPLEQVGNQSIQLASFVPTQWATMINSSVDLNAIFSKAKGILLGGAGLDSRLEKASVELDLPIFHTYGMTETISHIAYRDLQKQSTYFQCLPGVNVKLNDAGCLLIQGPMTGQHWIETQDVVRLVTDHTFEFIGRADRVINSGGKKIFPDVVETWVRRFFMEQQLSGEVLLVGIPDPFYGQKATLLTTIKLKTAQKIQLNDFLKNHIASEDCPKSIIYRPSFELLPNGKIDALKTLALYLETIK